MNIVEKMDIDEKSQDDLLEMAIEFAIKKHHGQRDKQGRVYILHPIRVMQSVNTYEEKMVAILHDVLEDTDATVSDLQMMGMPLLVIEALKTITRDKDNDSYFEYINKVKNNEIARVVKIMDLRDNLRDGCPESLITRYNKALKILKK